MRRGYYDLFFFSSRSRHTRLQGDWSSDVCSSDLLRPERDLASGVREADAVIEAVVEDLGVKQRLFAELERAAPAAALLATNTSSLSVAEIGRASCRERV